MLTIKSKEITYNSAEVLMEVSHCILIAGQDGKNILLSHPNIFLHSETRASIKTSKRYASIISMFYRFLSTQEKMKNKALGLYHVLADNRDIKLWQVQRQIDRVEAQSLRPSSETIYEDAKILLVYFKWLNDRGYLTNVHITLKTWRANFRSRRMLNYVQLMARSKIDASNIRVLDKKNRQKRSNFLITDPEIKLLLENYSDPVYAAMFNLALGTAMRPMDLVKFPYIGNKDNKHISPYSEMDKHRITTSYTVYKSKGNKDREITIHMADLKSLEENYIIPYYTTRKLLYKERYGHACPPGVLFLNKKGEPIDENMIASRTNYTKNKIIKTHPEFRAHLAFYQSRHWWPTQHIIATFGDRLLTESLDALYLATAQVLTAQMGHDDVQTTYKYYVDMARLIMLLHKGRSFDLVTSPAQTVRDFMNGLKMPEDVLANEEIESIDEEEQMAG
ncbi:MULTISPECIES: site-specific integrase [unclassified Pseudomonas]|uniref:site-specific integrase n=1 Tax=unclassified Pseudomonas TaxID=196821 RepID=UPI001CBBEAC4|nr:MULTISPECIES: site-specific integrase [unclassified Pseudomonas]